MSVKLRAPICFGMLLALMMARVLVASPPSLAADGEQPAHPAPPASVPVAKQPTVSAPPSAASPVDHVHQAGTGGNIGGPRALDFAEDHHPELPNREHDRGVLDVLTYLTRESS